MTTPVDLAIADLGYTEQPRGSNHTKYGDRFWPGQPSPWCAELVSCNTRDAGGTGPYSASVGYYRNQAAQQGRLTDLNGALAALAAGKCVSVGFEWGHDSWPDHIGWLLGQNPDGSIHTIEGNASGPDGTDEVAYHNRSLAQVAFFCVVDPAAGAGPAIPPPPPAEPPHPAYPDHPTLPSWMFLTYHPNGRPGYTNHGDKVGVFQAAMVQRHGGWWPNYTMHDVDGVIGPVTNDIIGRFQGLVHLKVDYIVGQNTWRAAFA